MRASRREQEIVLAIWLAASIVPLVTVYLGIHTFDEHSAWYYFGGFFGYFLLGYYTANNNISWKQIFTAAILGTMLMLICYMQSSLGVEVNCYLHPYVILYCFIVFATVKKLFCKTQTANNVLGILAASTFGVYLIHSLILNTWLKQIDVINKLPIESGILVRWAVTVIVGFGSVLVIKKISLHKYLVG